MCVNAGFIASDWVWLHGPVLGYWRLGLGLGDRWACPGSRRSKVRPCQLMRHCVIERTVRLDGSR